MNRRSILALGLAAIFSIGSVSDGDARQNDRRARRDHDQDVARQALQRGEVLPIARILEMVAQHQPGDVIEVQLEERRGLLRYEIKVLAPSGQVRELILDARTGALIRLED